MSRAKQYAKANMLWNNVAYVDQWQKVMAVFDECDNLRAVVKENDCGMYGVLLIGDSSQALYELDGIELRSTNKDMEACFQIYCRLQYLDTPAYIPSNRRTKQVSLHQVFPHTRVSARRTGGFRVTTNDLSEIIEKALERYDEIASSGVEAIDCSEQDDYDHGYPDTMWEGGTKMYHMGGGVYCDDDGDNWDFL